MIVHTWISSKTANTATGSTAAMRDPNSNTWKQYATFSTMFNNNLTVLFKEAIFFLLFSIQQIYLKILNIFEFLPIKSNLA